MNSWPAVIVEFVIASIIFWTLYGIARWLLRRWMIQVMRNLKKIERLWDELDDADDEDPRIR